MPLARELALRRVGLAGRELLAIVAPATDVERGFCDGLASHAVLRPLLDDAGVVVLLAATGRADTVRVLVVGQEGASFVAHAQEKLLVVEAGARLVGADLLALHHARDVVAGTPAHIV